MSKIVVLFGEIGTVAKEKAAEGSSRKEDSPNRLLLTSPVRHSPSGMRFSYASAIIERGRGPTESKIKALKSAGAYVVDIPPGNSVCRNPGHS